MIYYRLGDNSPAQNQHILFSLVLRWVIEIVAELPVAVTISILLDAASRLVGWIHHGDMLCVFGVDEDGRSRFDIVWNNERN